MQTAKLLIVDDDPDVLLAAKLLLKRHISQVDIEKNPDKLPFLLGNTRYDAVLLDMNFTRDVSSGKEGWGGRVCADSLLLVLRDVFRLKLDRTVIL